MDLIISGKATASQVAGLLAALESKGTTTDELCGFAASLRRRALKIDIDGSNLVDTCGTSGDGKNTFNISTTAAVVAAAAGVKIAKQGRGAVSSYCGSAEFLHSLKTKIDAGPKTIKDSIERVGIGLILVPLFHPSFKHFTQPVNDLGFRTVVDILVPLINPAGAKRYAFGVYSPAYLEKIATVLSRFDVERAVVFASDDGLDELSLSGVNQVVEINGINMRKYEITASDVGLKAAPIEAIKGGLAEDNVVMTLDVLNGREGAPLGVVAFNAGAAIYAGGKAESAASS